MLHSGGTGWTSSLHARLDLQGSVQSSKPVRIWSICIALTTGNAQFRSFFLATPHSAFINL